MIVLDGAIDPTAQRPEHLEARLNKASHVGEKPHSKTSNEKSSKKPKGNSGTTVNHGKAQQAESNASKSKKSSEAKSNEER